MMQNGKVIVDIGYFRHLGAFLLVSVLATIVDFLFLFEYDQLVKTKVLPDTVLHLGITLALGYLAGIITHFFISRRYVFSASIHAPAAEFFLVMLIGLSGWGLTEVIVLVGHHVFHLHVLLAKAIAVGIVFCWNYGARRWWVYPEVKSGLGK